MEGRALSSLKDQPSSVLRNINLNHSDVLFVTQSGLSVENTMSSPDPVPDLSVTVAGSVSALKIPPTAKTVATTIANVSRTLHIFLLFMVNSL